MKNHDLNNAPTIIEPENREKLNPNKADDIAADDCGWNLCGVINVYAVMNRIEKLEKM